MGRSLGEEACTVEALKARLGAEPMCLKVKDKVLESEGKGDHLVLFMYDQVKTKFGDAEFGEICKEARGIILRLATWDIVCYPFDKFFNAGEKHADEIDWSSAEVQEKLDGSIMKVWFNKRTEQWVVSTNGMVDARDATFRQEKTFYDMFFEAAFASGLKYDRLDKSHTYCFELLHPENTVVIPHPRPRLVHIGTRDIATLKELPEDHIGVEKPTVFSLHDLEACKDAAKALPATCEGYVVVDRSYAARIGRVKIKSPTYVALHHCAGGASSLGVEEAAAMVVLQGEESEVEAYKDQIKDLSTAVASVKARYDNLVARMEKAREEAAASAPDDAAKMRKHFAMTWNQSALPKPCFGLLMVRLMQLQGGTELMPMDSITRESFQRREKACKDFLAFTSTPWGEVI